MISLSWNGDATSLFAVKVVPVGGKYSRTVFGSETGTVPAVQLEPTLQLLLPLAVQVQAAASAFEMVPAAAKAAAQASFQFECRLRRRNRAAVVLISASSIVLPRCMRVRRPS